MDPSRLRRVALFSGLSKKELEQLARWADVLDVPEGTKLAAQGSFAHEFFVIEDGHAEVLQSGKHVVDLGPGDFFGEIGLLETERRTANVIARSPMQLIVMFQREFRAVEHEFPAVAERIRAAIRARLD